jgi:hypothetical protein
MGERGVRLYLRAAELHAVDRAIAQMLAGELDGLGDDEDEEAIVYAAERVQEKLSSAFSRTVVPSRGPTRWPA